MRAAMSSMRSPQMHVPKPDRRSAQGSVEGLSRVRLAAEPGFEVQVLPHRIDGGPERRRGQFDNRIPHRMLDLTVLDEVCLAARVLRIVSLVVDVPLHEALHVDPELD